jgi:hypothetical protein
MKRILKRALVETLRAILAAAIFFGFQHLASDKPAPVPELMVWPA